MVINSDSDNIITQLQENSSYVIYYRKINENSELINVLSQVWPQLVCWQEVTKGVKAGTLIESSDELLRVIYVDADTTFPQHCYNDASEILQVVYADNTTQMGASEQWAGPVQTDTLHFYIPSAPKYIKVCKSIHFDTTIGLQWA